MDGWIEGWIDGQRDGGMDERMDGRKDRLGHQVVGWMIGLDQGPPSF